MQHAYSKTIHSAKASIDKPRCKKTEAALQKATEILLPERAQAVSEVFGGTSIEKRNGSRITVMDNIVRDRHSNTHCLHGDCGKLMDVILFMLFPF